jgi:lipid A 3-O-deacylase
MERCRFIGITILLYIFSQVVNAQVFYGATLGLPKKTKEPADLHGYQFLLTIDPDYFHWRKFNIYFDAGMSQFWVNRSDARRIRIYSAAPIIRYTFRQQASFSHFFELSIGPAYLSRTRFEERNLGIHFAFQDRLGVGFTFGQQQNFSLALHAVHYSNAHLSSHNSGITIPAVLYMSYRF